MQHNKYYGVLYDFYLFCKSNVDFAYIINDKYAKTSSQHLEFKSIYNEYKSSVEDRSHIVNANFFYNIMQNHTPITYNCAICGEKMNISMCNMVHYFNICDQLLGCNRAFCLSDKERFKNTYFYQNLSDSLCSDSDYSDIEGIKITTESDVYSEYWTTSSLHFIDKPLCKFIQTYLTYRDQIITFFQNSNKKGNIFRQIVTNQMKCSYITADFDIDKLEEYQIKADIFNNRDNNMNLLLTSTRHLTDPKYMYSVNHISNIVKPLFKELCEVLMFIYCDDKMQKKYLYSMERIVDPQITLSLRGEHRFHCNSSEFIRLYNQLIEPKNKEYKELQQIVKAIDFKCEDINYVVYGYLFDINTFALV